MNMRAEFSDCWLDQVLSLPTLKRPNIIYFLLSYYTNCNQILLVLYFKKCKQHQYMILSNKIASPALSKKDVRNKCLAGCFRKY